MKSMYKLSLYRRLKDQTIRFATGSAAVIAVVPLILVFSYVLIKGIAGLDLNFLMNTPAPMGQPGGGILNSLVGSVLLVLLATAMSAPLGILVGIYLSEYRRQKFADFLQIIMDLLASTPSIVVGLFAYTFIVVPTKGFSALAGAGALSFIMIPVISRTSESILKLNSKEIREAALALGLTRWRMIFFVLVRGSWGAIITGVLLAIARCAGETAPLIFTAFNNQYLSFNLREPISSLPVQIYTYAVSPFKELQARAWTGALVLLVAVFFTNLFIRLLMTRTNENRR